MLMPLANVDEHYLQSCCCFQLVWLATSDGMSGSAPNNSHQ